MIKELIISLTRLINKYAIIIYCCPRFDIPEDSLSTLFFFPLSNEKESFFCISFSIFFFFGHTPGMEFFWNCEKGREQFEVGARPWRYLLFFLFFA